MANTVLHADIKIVGPLPSGTGQKILTVNPLTGEVGQIDSFVSGVTGDITIDDSGVASITAGVIVNADINASAAIAWSKMAAQTASRVMVTDASGVATTSFTTTVLNYVANLSSDAQAQINSKQGTVVGAASTVVTADLAPNMAVVAGPTGKIEVHPSTTRTEIGYITGVTSAIQTQLNARLTVSLTSPAEGDVIMFNGTSWVNLGRGTNGYVLTSTASTVQWSPNSATGVPSGGAAGQVLSKIDGTDYNTHWVTVTTPPGSDTQVIFNDGGVYGADAGMVYNKTTNVLTVGKLIGAPTATLTGLNFGTYAGDPSSLSTSDIWYNSTSNTLTFYHAGGPLAFVFAGPGGVVSNAVPFMSSIGSQPSLSQTNQFTYTSATRVLNVGIVSSAHPSEAGIRFNSLTADPGALSNGYAWYNSTSNQLKARINGITGAFYITGGTDVAVADGGTGLSSIAGLSILVANSADTYVALTPAAGQSLRINAGGTAWEAYTPATGDVVGPASSVDNAIARYDLTTGKLIQDSSVIISDTGDLTLGKSSTGGTERIIASDGSAGTVDIRVNPKNGQLYIGTTGGNEVRIGQNEIVIDGGAGSSLSAPTDLTVSSGNSLTLRTANIAGTNSGDVIITSGNASTSGFDSGNILIDIGTNAGGGGTTGNIGLFTTTGSFGSGEKVMFINNATTAPSGNPANGVIMYSADISASAVPHFKNEAGDIVKLYSISGWGTPSGTLTRTTFDSGTVTLPQLAERVAALLTDLKTSHGLLKA